MQQHTVVANDLADGPQDKRLQWIQVAARVFPELETVSKAKRARKAGNLLLNGQPLVATLTCAAVNDVLVYLNSEKRTQWAITDNAEDLEAQLLWLQTCKTQGLRQVYECGSLAVVVKPVGIHVKGRGKRTVERALPLLLQGQQSIEAGDRMLPLPHAVHRLDYRVGGLLLVAKTRKMEVELSAQFERHSVTKQYRAILVGDVRETFQALNEKNCTVIDSIELPNALQSICHELQILDDPIDGRTCLTAVRVVSTTRSARYDWISTVDLWPLTGRKHQLRVHTARHGHPIVGDDLYHNTSNIVCQHGSGNKPAVVRGMGLFLFSVGVAFNDLYANRRSFSIGEPHKFARFRHFCNLNWSKLAARQTQDANKQATA
ncbi:unnamed protein product [Peronospora belbahrii]|uniref:Pseudouridine synthase RsuA/RluA-like domain-containing protein n=1 Tax=Peronospora belbahrii TaxID=622444 RepID=A0AAU9KXA4_9STRA|nr:unnamed protein product [Peronospora belbahrii]CAH0518282.1 unnamed protein product [Peronospora belbahrii]